MNTIVRWQNSLRLLGSDLPRHLHLLGDGGSENVNGTMVVLFAWLVSWGVFDEITVHRFPVGHTHSIIDQRFSVIAQYLLGPMGIDCPTVEKMLARVKEAFSGEYNKMVELGEGGELQQDEYIVQGGEPIVKEMQCTHDYDAFFDLLKNKHLKGYGSAKRLYENSEGVIDFGVAASSEVMIMNFYKPLGSDVAKMRYKTAAQYDDTHYLPSEGGSLDVFDPQEVSALNDLPGLGEAPPLARFKFHKKKKSDEDVRKGKPAVSKMAASAKVILDLRHSHPGHVSAEDHMWWVEEIKKWPKHEDDVDALSTDTHPLYGPMPRTRAIAALHQGPLLLSASASGCSHDPRAIPFVASVTDSAAGKKAKDSEAAALVAGTYM